MSANDDPRIDPRGIRPGYDAGHLGASGASSGQSLVFNGTTWVPTNLPVLLTTEINGVPDLVWDDDNQLVYTEAP